MRGLRRSTGWPHALLLVFTVVGVYFGTSHDHDYPADPPVTSSCDGVTVTEERRGAADALVQQGWHATGTRLYPPHCR